MTTPRNPNCDFCDEFSGNAQNTFDRIYRQDPKSRVLFRSDDFVVVPSLGQIAEGHLLILPIRHWTALADLAEPVLGQFAELSASVTAILSEEYGSCISFEHGVRFGGTGGCGIYHAHLHAVPFSTALDPVDSLESNFHYKRLTDLRELKGQSEGIPGYLFYQDTHSRAYLFDAPNLVSQYMRKVLAEMLGTDGWDWRTARREERLLATLNRLSSHFDNLRFSAAAHCK